MSNVVWTPERGWHDGPEARIELGQDGRIVLAGNNYDRPGDLFPRCDGCGRLYGCMRRQCHTCATTNLCHGCASTD
jgi:hypothetical protein